MENNNSGNWGMSLKEAIHFYTNLINKGKVKVPGPAMERLKQLKQAKARGIKKFKDIPKIPVGY